MEADVAVEIITRYLVEADSDLLLEAVCRGTFVAVSTDEHRRDQIGRFEYHLDLVEPVGLTLKHLRLWPYHS